MARYGISEQEVDKFMKENYGYKPRLEDFMLDLMSNTPMLLGFPMQISRPAAHKQLAKSFMKMGRSNLNKVKSITQDILDLRTENPASDIAKGMEETLKRLKWFGKKGKNPRAYQPEEIGTWKEFMKGLRNVPEELLDPLKTIKYESTNDYGAVVQPAKEMLKLSTSAEDAYNVLAHEFTHVEDLKGHFGFEPDDWDYEDIDTYARYGTVDHFDEIPTDLELRQMKDIYTKHQSRGFYEGKAYETGDRLEPSLREGPVDYNTWLETMGESEEFIENKYGRDVHELDILQDYVPGHRNALEDVLQDLLNGIRGD